MNDEMTPTKTYPLSAIMGEEITDKERIAELEAEVKMLRKDAERYWCLRDNCEFAITQNDWINLIFADEIDAAIDAARDGK